MATQGPNYPAAAEGVSLGVEVNNDWVSPANVGADDGSEASITASTYDNTDVSFILVATDFGFTIPTDATIDGLVVEIERRKSAGAASDHRVMVWDGASGAIGDNKAALSTDWPTTAGIATYGSSSDGWNASLTPALLNGSINGLAFSVDADANNTDIHVDFIRMTVHYTEAAGGATGSGSPTATLSASASGTATRTLNDSTGSGAPTKTLSISAVGTAVLMFVGAGSPTAILAVSAAGTAVQTFVGSGAPTAALSASAAGTATNTVDNSVTGSGAPTAALSASAAGTATHTPDNSTGSGAPSKTLSVSASGVASMTFTGSGTPTAALSASAAGTATHTPDNSTGSGSPTAALSASAVGTATNSSPAPGQVARPIADLFISGWEEDDGTTTDLFDQIDETVRDDNDYIRSVVGPSGAVAVFRLSPLAVPSSTEGLTLRYVVGKNITGGQSITVTVQLRQGYVSEGTPGTLLGEWIEGDVDALTQVARTLSSAVVESITNFSELDVRVVADQNVNVTGSGAAVKTLVASAIGFATRSQDGITFMLADAEDGTMNAWDLLVSRPLPDGQVNPYPSNSATRAKNGSRSYKFEITAPGTDGRSTSAQKFAPPVSMGGTGRFQTGYYSWWMYIDAGYTGTAPGQDAWNMILGWMAAEAIGGAPDPISHFGLEVWAGQLQFVYVLKNAEVGNYTPPTIPGYTQEGNGGYYLMNANSPAGLVLFPRNQWVHVCIYYEQARTNGHVILWQDGVKIMDLTAPTMNTMDGHVTLTSPNQRMTIQFNNYGGVQSETQRFYADDFKVTDFQVTP